MVRDMKWALNNFQSVDRIVYVIACIASMGLVYLIRVVITQAVADGIAMNERWKEVMKS